MKVIYAREPLPKWVNGDEWGSQSIFLAGPTPRSKEVPSWRPEALRLLEGFEGTVYVPEDREGPVDGFDYTQQIEWEHEALGKAGCVLFWVPRDLATMPGFTTNVEFGLLYKEGKCVFGAPEGAPKTRYLRALAKQVGMRTSTNLAGTVKNALARLGVGLELFSRFSVTGKRTQYSTGKETDLRYFLGGDQKLYAQLPATIAFMEEVFGKDIPLLFELDCYPDDGSQSCTLYIGMEYADMDEWAKANDHMIDRWVEQRERPFITLQLCSEGLFTEDDGDA